MGCKLGFDNSNEDERTLPKKNLYDAVIKLRARLKEDAGTETGRFIGPDIAMVVPIDRPFEIQAVECKGWYREQGCGSVFSRGCTNCAYRIYHSREK